MKKAAALSSIISPEYLAEFVIKTYNLDKNTTCEILKIGINHTYLITTPSIKYVFRVYFLDWRTQLDVEEELKLLNYLNKNGISVSYPILDIKSNYIQKINATEGERFAVLFTYAEGKTIRIPSEELCFNLGVSMAKMHQKTINKTIDRKTHDAENLVQWAYKLAENHFDDQSESMQYYKRAVAKITSEFKHANTNKLRKGIVHLDLWHDNLKVKNNTEITYFDFDNCGNGWLFLDIAYSLMLFLRNDPNKENFKLKSTSFFHGYESVTPISDEEKRLIPYGGLAIWLYYNGVHVARFNDFSNQFLSEDFLTFWIQTVKRWMETNHIKI